ncbi:MAG TPA: erythromycin esterase family protein [Gemmatimonadaceae bacterium]|nr:erythromycin esterase family protein [Gemmatimonadaceae bacterium]
MSLFSRKPVLGHSDDIVVAELEDLARPLDGPAHLDPLIEAIGDAKYVLLGEATHGTSEFYTWRTEITRQLIREKQFSFVAVEGDWPDCYRVNQYVKGGEGESPEDVLHTFSRWPTWMWANREVAQLVRWMRAHNDRALDDRKVGFYGLDVYSLWESMDAVIEYLKQVDPDAVSGAHRNYGCFEPYNEDAQEYAAATALVPTSCQAEAVAALVSLRAKAGEYTAESDRDSFFAAEQNAIIAKNAELYYRTMVRGGPTSWNVRDHHMMETLDRLMQHHGPYAKAIVWEHNTHIGDARFTDMSRAGMVNVGQLTRQQHEKEGVFLVGFGTYKGSVIAASEWGAPMKRMDVPAARDGSHEAAMHQAVGRDSLFIFRGEDEEATMALRQPRGNRAIGVVYNSNTESWGNYVATILPERYDAFIYIEESKAVDPLHMPAEVGGELPETFPSGE